MLTGESVPVRKVASRPDGAGPPHTGGDDLPFVFSGTLVVRGSGVAEVTSTGIKAEIGKIGQTLQSLETETPRASAADPASGDNVRDRKCNRRNAASRSN